MAPNISPGSPSSAPHTPGTANRNGARSRSGANGRISRDQQRELKLVHKLLAQGRRQGYVTLDDVKGTLGRDNFDADQFETMKGFFGEHDVALGNAGPRIVSRRRSSSPPRASSLEAGDGPTNDPVRVKCVN